MVFDAGQWNDLPCTYVDIPQLSLCEVIYSCVWSFSPFKQLITWLGPCKKLGKLKQIFIQKYIFLYRLGHLYRCTLVDNQWGMGEVNFSNIWLGVPEFHNLLYFCNKILQRRSKHYHPPPIPTTLCASMLFVSFY